jgi:pimeloyl-ACP methyl ester carboxylesterase
MVLLATHEWPPPTTDSTAAPVAVFVHGIGGWWRTWWRVAPALADHGFRVVAVDLRGHGDSPRIDGTVTREEMASDLADTIEALGVAPVEVVIGHSLGAAVVIELAHARPELLSRAVLEDPPGSDRSGDVAYQKHLAAEVRSALKTPDAEVERLLAENPSWLRQDAVQDVEGRQRMDIRGIGASLRAGMGARVPELVPILNVPALYLLASEQRSAVTGEPRATLIAGVPVDSRLVEIDSGHVIHRDRFDDYLALVIGWVEQAARA